MKVVGVWIGLIVAALFTCFEVLNVDQMEEKSGAGGIVALVLAVTVVAAALITRSMRKPSRPDETGVGRSSE